MPFDESPERDDREDSPHRKSFDFGFDAGSEIAGGLIEQQNKFPAHACGVCFIAGMAKGVVYRVMLALAESEQHQENFALAIEDALNEAVEDGEKLLRKKEGP